MRRQHLETLRPVCPVCRTESQSFPLQLGHVEREEEDDVVEGVLLCANPNCQREYPILDGIPLLIPALRSYVRDNVLPLLLREDLSDVSESLLGDCCGPGTPFDVLRQQLSCYAWDHYADLDPQEATDGPQPGSVVRLLQQGLTAAQPLSPGPLLDVGCAVGRSTLLLAEQAGALVLGVDLNFGMLRLAARALRRGRVRYPRRRVGLVYERREFPLALPHRARIDFWACDATALPFAEAPFATVVCLNVLDCVAAPLELLRSLSRVLKPHGKAILSCPYDWSPSATAAEAWLGGHSQRGPAGGACEPVLRALLTPGAHPCALDGLRIIQERERLPWHVRLHERSVMMYQVHLLVVQAEGRGSLSREPLDSSRAEATPG